MECAKAAVGVRKVKKKQVKDEFDRMKQAEKKKRRLEKALATSAAIRSELEKKKQKKKEELDRLDEEGAAMAEAAALHVLLGEDSDNSNNEMAKEGLIRWGHSRDFGVNIDGRQSLLPYCGQSKYSLGSAESVFDAQRYGCKWDYWGNSDLMGSSAPLGRDFFPKCFGEGSWSSVDLSASHLAAQVVSSLKIADDARVDDYVFNQMLRG